jgi:hypothetical protein
LFDLSRWMAHQNLPPKSFTATHFEPRIDVKPWFDMMSREIPRRPIRVPMRELPNEESEPDPKRPRKSQPGALREDTAGHFPHAAAAKRQAPEGQPVGYSSSSAMSASYRSNSSKSEAAQKEKFAEPILPKKKIPYKDKFILVRLPPPPPQKQPDLRPEDGGLGCK